MDIRVSSKYLFVFEYRIFFIILYLVWKLQKYHVFDLNLKVFANTTKYVHVLPTNGKALPHIV